MDYFCAGFPDLFLVKKWHTKEALCRLPTEEIVTSNGKVVAYSDRLLDAFQPQINGFLGMELRDSLAIKIDFTRGGGHNA